MILGSTDELREFLLGLSRPEAIIAVFLAACAIGGACIAVRSAIRAAPEVIRDLRAWRSVRS